MVKMLKDYQVRSRFLQIEAADFLKRSEIINIISPYGKIHFSGSYEFETMCWHGIDIILQIEDILNSKNVLREVTAKLYRKKEIVDIHFIDCFNFKIRKGLPKGFFIGFDIIDEKIVENWRIDIWILCQEDFNKSQVFANDVKTKMTDELKDLIIKIKFALLGEKKKLPQMISNKLYEAILFKNMRDEEEIKKFVEANTQTI
tara:strand:- start:1788 stop:2393 length:606 start_codon:yes stop_codon:yes gene_type:complete